MTEARFDGTWEGWRKAARSLLSARIDPSEILWTTGASLDGLLEQAGTEVQDSPRVPPALIEEAKVVACHRNPEPWRVLYRLFFRIASGERHLPEVESDPDVVEFRRMEKAVRRDMHKMHAFVRFRKTPDDEYVAWHRPDHRILRMNAGFFVRRFGSLRWAILTPDESAWWDLRELRFGPGVSRAEAPSEDELESLWRAYYASVFNPARVNKSAMIKELPVRHWATLPEAELIPGLLRDAARQVSNMRPAPSAAPFVPVGAALPVLREAVRECRGCELYRHATHAVFGEGPRDARLVLVGEQPGDREDLAGRPFVGPAGEVLDQALSEAGIDRSQIYLTNAVKHFKFTERGKRRIHAKPRGAEIAACRPWVQEELSAIRPSVVVCMGATAAQSIIGRVVRIQAERGHFMPHHVADEAMVTIHPSAILRIPDSDLAEAARRNLRDDLRKAALRSGILPPAG